MNNIPEKYRHVLDVPKDSILGVQLVKQSQQPKSLGPMPPSREELLTVLITVLHENPWMADSSKNGELVAHWIEENHLHFNLESVRGAVKVLKNDLEKAKPPEPPSPAAPPAPVEPVELLESNQLCINASTFEMKHATPAQLKDLIKRQQAAKRKR